MALDTSGFVPKGNLNASSDALAKKGKAGTVKRVLAFLVNYRVKIILILIIIRIVWKPIYMVLG